MLHKISASAGSGKTYTLTNEFLTRLHGASTEAPLLGCALNNSLASYSLSEIIAATFTNKAAAEMKSRIVSKLKEQAISQLATAAAAQQDFLPPQFAASPPYSPQYWVDYIIKNYSSLQIRTIDSLLTTLVRLSVLELGLSPEFTPSFSAEEYFLPAYEALIEDLSIPRPAPELFITATKEQLLHSIDKACETLILTSAKKGYAVKTTLSDTLQELVDRLLKEEPVPNMDTNEIYALLNTLINNLKTVANTVALGIAQEHLQAAKRFLDYLGKIATWQGFQSFTESAYGKKNELDECLNKASVGTASALLEKQFEEFTRAYTMCLTMIPLFKSALRLAPLTMLANEIYARIIQKSMHNTLVPAISIPLLAKKVLQAEHGISSALCRLGTRLRHILLDEFQDTSTEQWASLLPLVEECLANGGSLTYVGDVKQAIYSWRGGQASLFNGVQQEATLLAIAPQPRSSTLPYNWRSSPRIIQHNNNFFSLIANPTTAKILVAEMLPSGTPAAYIEQAANQVVSTFAQVAQKVPEHKVNTQDNQGNVHLYHAEGSTTADVQEMVKNRLHTLFTQDLFPRWQYQDVAILVRSGTQGVFITNLLSEWNIPVITENSFLLAEQPIIRRLSALLTFLDYPLDNIAFWEFITGEECFGAVTSDTPELSSAALHAWITTIAVKDRPPLYLLFKEKFPSAWNTWIAPFFNQAGLMSAYDIIAEIINKYNLLHCNPAYPALLRRFMELAYLAETKGLSSLASFLHFWQQAKNTEKVPLPEGMNAVQVLTMHKAKGLEFPVVVLPFHHTGKSYGATFETFTCANNEYLAKAGKEHADKFYANAVTEALENLHLLYVAWTRPVTELHAFITLPKTSIGHSPISRALLFLLEQYKNTAPQESYTYEYLTLPEEPVEETPWLNASVCTIAHTTATPCSSAEAKQQQAEQQQLPNATPLHPQANAAANTFADVASPLRTAPAPLGTALQAHTQAALAPTTEPWRPMAWLPRLKIFRSVLHNAAFTAERRGTLAHLCLEHFTYSAASLTAFGEQKELLIQQDLTLAIQHALRLFPLPLERPDDVAQEMLQCLTWFVLQPSTPHWLQTGSREQGLLDANGNVFRVDLLVEDPQGSLHAIDYKTGKANPQYFTQVQNYMRLLTTAQHKPVQGTLVYLDEQTFVQVPL